MLKTISVLNSILFFALCGHFAMALDPVQVQKDLQGSGAVGWIHGSAPDQKIYVFTVRNPQNFFDYAEFSLTSDSELILQQLSQLSRHDQVRIKGNFLDIPSPQIHIDISSIETLLAYESGVPTKPYEHQTQIPEDLIKTTEATFLVHAVAGDGAVLVLEYQDVVVPVFVKKTELTKSLYRGDLIHLHYTIQHRPKEPVHLNLDESFGEKALQVMESIKAQHGKNISIEGRLVLFPKSPEIKFNVFAVEQNLSSGLRRQYTLVNFEDPELFQKIRQTLQTAWDQNPQFVNGRNKLISTKVRVQVTGVINEIDPSQANPQILIPHLDALIVEPQPTLPTSK